MRASEFPLPHARKPVAFTVVHLLCRQFRPGPPGKKAATTIGGLTKRQQTPDGSTLIYSLAFVFPASWSLSSHGGHGASCPGNRVRIPEARHGANEPPSHLPVIRLATHQPTCTPTYLHTSLPACYITRLSINLELPGSTNLGSEPRQRQPKIGECLHLSAAYFQYSTMAGHPESAGRIFHPPFPPPRFWDNLSQSVLTKSALRELQRRNDADNSRAQAESQHRRYYTRNQALLRRTSPDLAADKVLNRLTATDRVRIRRFARQGGPSLEELRGVRLSRPE